MGTRGQEEVVGTAADIPGQSWQWVVQVGTCWVPLPSGFAFAGGAHPKALTQSPVLQAAFVLVFQLQKWESHTFVIYFSYPPLQIKRKNISSIISPSLLP